MSDSITVEHNPCLGLAWTGTTGKDWKVHRAVDPGPLLRAELARSPETRLSYAGPRSLRRYVFEVASSVGAAGRLSFNARRYSRKAVAGVLQYCLSQPAMSSLFEPAALDRLKRELHLSEFRVAVVAPMSTGKSTLINAMLGRNLLPSGNLATTSKATRIIDTDHLVVPIGEALGNAQEIIDSGPVDSQRLLEWNHREDVRGVRLKADLPWVAATRGGTLVVCDTPGPNFSGDARHRHEFEQTVASNGTDRFDVVLFVMDFTNLQVDDESRVLDSVIQQVGAIDDRFVFAVNKIDCHNIEREGNLNEAILDHRRFIEGRFGLSNARVVPVSARAALLARMALSRAVMSPREAHELEYLADVLPNGQSPHSLRRLVERFRFRTHPVAHRLLAKSGILDIEQHIARSVRLFGAWWTYRRVVHELASVVEMPELTAPIHAEEMCRYIQTPRPKRGGS